MEGPPQFGGEAGECADQNVQSEKNQKAKKPPGMVKTREFEPDQEIGQLAIAFEVFDRASMLGNESSNYGSDGDDNQQDDGQSDRAEEFD